MADFLERMLDAVEEREGALLVWGAVDGCFSAGELESLIDPALNTALDRGEHIDFVEARTVIGELVRRAWLIEVPLTAGSVGYRSRMAETVRLLARLRQLFPQHGRTNNGWQVAATLVADFRFARRQRQYPRRNVRIDGAIAELRSITSEPLIIQNIEAILHSVQPIRDGGLAAFQVRATQRILAAIEADRPGGTIVCAGTGSGKTLAFYLPAMASILRHLSVQPDGPNWVKAVAIYPRNELLKDQLREVFGRVRAMPRQNGHRPLRIGAFYGDVPKRAGNDMAWPAAWTSAGNHRICPFLKCPACGSDLLWREEAFIAQREVLSCRSNTCDFATNQEELALTRDSQAERPPDIVFTSTEMLNRRLSDTRYCHLFGVGGRAHRAAELVLLDEVHTYEGGHGAQVAFLLRRWQCLTGSQLRFVGLSATLRDASRFFADLIGARPNSVVEISPAPAEMESEGAEYVVAIRGDPVSRAALLSTTIQATMLMQRCLDRRPSIGQDPVGRGMFGTRTFAFTDKLDSINRLYFDLLDAEGRDNFGAPDRRRAPNGGLALLRIPGPSRSRYLAGQDWRACTAIQHDLADRLTIGRVSSQDRGVDTSADVIVATASLEVGFDDPNVGAIIQHKAPYSMAAFLQRKGRAGRQRGMRPWTIVTLSDYGRDRLLYQNYDRLFDPELPVRTLPLRSRYILRMQATYAFLDYLSTRIPSGRGSSMWSALSMPSQGPNQNRLTIAREIRGILEGEVATADFAEYLSRALHLDLDEIAALLWEYPRALLTTVLPTALRRLETAWRGELPRVDRPLPEFIPSSLFSELALPEVRIQLQRQNRNNNNEVFMPLFAAVSEFTPGRVSRRFGVRQEMDRDWICPPASVMAGAPLGVLDLDLVAELVPEGVFELLDGGRIQAFDAFRPTSLNPTRPPGAIGDSSMSKMRWNTRFLPLGDGTWLIPPSGSVGHSVFRRVGFFCHTHHMPLEVRRFAVSCEAEIVISRTRQRAEIRFAKDGRQAAVGGAFAADGIAFDIEIPAQLFAAVSADARLQRALRTLRFSDAAWRGETLSAVPNPFQREWLAQIQLSALAYEAVRMNCTLQQAAVTLASGAAAVSTSDVLTALFGAQVVQDDGRDLQLVGDDRLRRDIQSLLADPTVVGQLSAASVHLWEAIDYTWEPWLRSIYHTTLGAALLRAISDRCPGLDMDGLVADLDVVADSDGTLRSRIWITENAPGGNGQVEQFMRAYAEDPRRFYSMVRAALEMGEREIVDDQLGRLVRLLCSPAGEYEATIAAVARLRQAFEYSELSASVREVRLSISRDGIVPFHGFMAAAMGRVLRPNSSPSTDRYLAHALDRWDTEEARLGIEIDLRVVSYWLAQFQDIDDIAQDLGLPVGNDKAAWRLSAIYGLLWPRGRPVRASSLESYNPFTEVLPVERLMVLGSLIEERTRISVEGNNWLEATTELLANGRMVTLICATERAEYLSEALNELICNPVESGYLRAYARMQGVRIGGLVLEADIELIEAPQ
jgi:hypothetical protein